MKCPEGLPQLFQELALQEPAEVRLGSSPLKSMGVLQITSSPRGLISSDWDFHRSLSRCALSFVGSLPLIPIRIWHKVYKGQGKWAWCHYLWYSLAAADPSSRAVFSFQTTPSPGSGTAAALLGAGVRPRVSVSLLQTACDWDSCPELLLAILSWKCCSPQQYPLRGELACVSVGTKNDHGNSYSKNSGRGSHR